METQNSRAVDVVMARAKRIYILIIRVNKLFSFFSSRCFLKEIENMYSVFLSSCRNTRESLGELEKAVETLTCRSCSHSTSRSPKLSLVFSIETRYIEFERTRKSCGNTRLRLVFPQHISFSQTFTRVFDRNTVLVLNRKSYCLGHKSIFHLQIRNSWVTDSAHKLL